MEERRGVSRRSEGDESRSRDEGARGSRERGGGCIVFNR